VANFLKLKPLIVYVAIPLSFVQKKIKRASNLDIGGEVSITHDFLHLQLHAEIAHSCQDRLSSVLLSSAEIFNIIFL